MGTKRRLALMAIIVEASLAGAQLGYRRILRPWCLFWGASAAEVKRALPGDERVAAPAVQTTRAITIASRPEAIWPWLVQMGQGRAGAYTYDWVENLFGLGMHSANSILPEFQHPAVGDIVLKSTVGGGMKLETIVPNHFLLSATGDGAWSWVFVLEPLDDARTRLVSRNRLKIGPRLVDRLAMRIMEFGSLVMERKMLLGIKQRAERCA